MIDLKAMRLVACSLLRLACVLLLAWSASASAQTPGCNKLRAWGGDYNHWWWPIQQVKTDGSRIDRHYNIHVPWTHIFGAPLPVVFDLHASFNFGFSQDWYSGMRRKGDESGFIVVQPDSVFPKWAATQQDESDQRVDDVAFLKRLLELASDNLCIDLKRIYFTGFSSGGVMSARMACESAASRLGTYRLAAIAPVAAGPLPAGPVISAPICPQRVSDPIPMRVIISNNDLTLAAILQMSVPQLNEAARTVTATWAAENGCAPGAFVHRSSQKGWGALEETVTYNCGDVARNRGDTVLDFFGTGDAKRDGHVWPGQWFGGTYKVTDAIWNFFATHPRH